jgi:hypothetical protein
MALGRRQGTEFGHVSIQDDPIKDRVRRGVRGTDDAKQCILMDQQAAVFAA